MHCYKDYGGTSYWVGDGFCDDRNNNEACDGDDDIDNNEACDGDDGDCCGLSMKKNFCVNCICKGKLNQIACNQWKKLNQSYFFFLVFTCKTDADCYGNGYCHARECICSANYEYAQDCSHHGCKYIQQTFVFLFTLKWMYQYIHTS